MGLFNRSKQQESLESGLEKTRTSLFGKLNKLVRGKDRVDEEILDQLEEALVTSDVGVQTTVDIIRKVEERVARDKFVSTDDLNALIRDEITGLLLTDHPERPIEFSAPLPQKPHVIMVVGVNGVGKTTSIGKLAARYREAGKTVMLGAADTYRAAATEQLDIWAERAGVPIIKQGHGADPAAVAFDTLGAAKARDMDIVLVDTAGRLHTKGGLMDELSKIKRVMQKLATGVPHEVGHGSSDSRSTTRSASGPGRFHRSECHPTGPGIHPGGGCDGAHPDQAGWHGQGGYRDWHFKRVPHPRKIYRCR